MKGFPQRSKRVESKAEASDIWKFGAMEKVNGNKGTRRDYRPVGPQAIHLPHKPTSFASKRYGGRDNRAPRNPQKWQQLAGCGRLPREARANFGTQSAYRPSEKSSENAVFLANIGNQTK